MPNSILRKTMTLLLSALVLAWGIVPPGVEHSHAGGSDTAHGHENGHEVVHQGSHDHDSDGQHCELGNIPQSPLLADSFRHLHWQLLGMNFSMPAPVQPADDGDDESTVPPTIVRVADEGVPVVHAGSSLARIFLCGVCAPSTDVVWSLQPIPQPPNLVTSMPLCDSARQERSGVLLA